MKKQKILLIVVLILAIAIVGLYYVIELINGQEEQSGDEVTTVTMLTEMENITYVQYKNAEGVVTLVKTEDEWKCEENTELVLIDVYVNQKVTELGKIKGTLVEDMRETECGLDEPVYTLTMRNSEKEVRLVFGADEEEHCYAMLEGKNDIYEISEDIIAILNLSVDSFTAQDDILTDKGIIEEDLEEEVIPDTKLEDEPIEDEPIEDEPIEDEPIEDTL